MEDVIFEIAAMEADFAWINATAAAKPFGYVIRDVLAWRLSIALDGQEEEPAGSNYLMLSAIDERDMEIGARIWAPVRTVGPSLALRRRCHLIGRWVDEWNGRMPTLRDRDIASLRMSGVDMADYADDRENIICREGDFDIAGELNRKKDRGLAAAMRFMLDHGFAWGGDEMERRALFCLIAARDEEEGAAILGYEKLPGSFLDRDWRQALDASTRLQLLLVWLPAMSRQIRTIREVAARSRRLREEWEGSKGRDREGVESRLLDYLFRQPILSAHAMQRRIGISRGNMQKLIQRFRERGIIEDIGSRGYNRIYAARRIVDLIELGQTSRY